MMNNDLIERARDNYEGCNHRLSRRAIAAAEDMSRRFGNAKFNPRSEGYDSGIVEELLEQRFLAYAEDGMVRRCLEIMGKPPLTVRRG